MERGDTIGPLIREKTRILELPVYVDGWRRQTIRSVSWLTLSETLDSSLEKKKKRNLRLDKRREFYVDEDIKSRIPLSTRVALLEYQTGV